MTQSNTAHTKDNEHFNAQIVDIALPDGLPLARHEGMVVFLDKGVVGDTVQAHIIQRKKNFSYGVVDSIITPSADRIDPQCPHYSQCGGCVCQDLSYDKQLEVKRNYLIKTLKSIGNVNADILDPLVIEPSPSLYGYRNKISFSFGMDNDKPVIGLQGRIFPPGSESQQLIRINQCPLFAGDTQEIVKIIEQFFDDKDVTVYNAATRNGFLRNLVIRHSKQTGDMQVSLYTTEGSVEGLDILYQTMIEKVPSVKNFYHYINTHSYDSFGDYKVASHFGDSAITEICGELQLKVYPQTFMQPNTEIADQMYSTIKTWITEIEPKSVLGLYCGSGAMELSVASIAKKVTGVDANPVNIVGAVENSAINEITNTKFINKTVEQFIKSNRKTPTLVLIDPPRNGISKPVRSAIATMGSEYICYMSCNAASMARDLASLQANGYTPEKVHAFDQFPHTGHCETLVLMRLQQE